MDFTYKKKKPIELKLVILKKKSDIWRKWKKPHADIKDRATK